MEVVDIYLTKIEDNNIFMCIGSLQYFYWNKSTHESIDVVLTHYNKEKTRQYLSNMLIWDT